MQVHSASNGTPGGRAPLVYMDCSATTPLSRGALDAMMPFLTSEYGNPSGAYALGRGCREALEDARSTVAEALRARPSEIVFTSGGTEADNLALRGAARAMRERGRGAHIITSAVEHEAVLATARDLAAEGFDLTVLGVDEHGGVSAEDVLEALRDDTVVVSVMMANNEVGTRMPVDRIAAALRTAGSGALVHTDAVQAPAWCDLDVERLGVDLLSISAHKFYGPKGVGALYVRDGTPLASVQTGGGQEHGLRAGTENVAGIVGLGHALASAVDRRRAAAEQVELLRDRLIEHLCAIDGVRLTGHPTDRLPHHASFCVRGARADVLLLGLDMRGICASSGSACSSGKLSASHVLSAMGVADDEAHGALRFSLGRFSTDDDVDRVLDVLPGLIERSRAVRHVA